jgi:hypothetical protein
MYRARVFDAEIIELCVRWYITYRLSYRDPVSLIGAGAYYGAENRIGWRTTFVSDLERTKRDPSDGGSRQKRIVFVNPGETQPPRVARLTHANAE